MIDLLIIVLFVAYSVTAGFRARSAASRSLEEYFLAGRSIRGWQAGLSMSATQYAADTPLLAAGLIATGGIFTLWRLWIYGLAFLMMGFLLGPAWRRARVITDAELVTTRYSGEGVPLLRALKAVYFGTIINCTVLAMVLVAATRICEVFLPWHEWLPESFHGLFRNLVDGFGIDLSSGLAGSDPATATANNLISIGFIFAFVALYSTTGGLRSVIATDVVQFATVMAATLIYAFYAVGRAGGLDGMLSRLSDLYGAERAGEFLSLSPGLTEALAPFLTVVALQWFFQRNSAGPGYLAQRTMACRSDRDGILAGVVFSWAQILFRSLLWLPIGVALLVLYPFAPGEAVSETFAAGREALFVTGIKDLLPAGARGLMLTGLLAALASTIDTHLNWGASYWANDLYKGILCERWLRRSPGRRETVLVARLSTLVILVISLAIMANLGSIQTAWRISLLFGAGIGSVLVLRWFWERINLHSEIAAIAVSLVAAPALLVWVKEDWVRLLLMSLLSTLAVIAVALTTPCTEERVLDRFYRRVRPPGVWRRTALRAGEDPGEPGRAFRRGAYLVATTALSIYLLLTGVTKLLLPPPGAGRIAGWVLLVLGLASVALWWRPAFGAGGSGSTVADRKE
jgi:Na+/proline symporter